MPGAGIMENPSAPTHMAAAGGDLVGLAVTT